MAEKIRMKGPWMRSFTLHV